MLSVILLVSEGLDDVGEVFPQGGDPNPARFRIFFDPIDGTRGLMYDKRSAWVLTGVAANRGIEANLTDIFAAVQAEIPTSKQFRSDVLSVARGLGLAAFGVDVTLKQEAPDDLRVFSGRKRYLGPDRERGRRNADRPDRA